MTVDRRVTTRKIKVRLMLEVSGPRSAYPLHIITHSFFNDLMHVINSEIPIPIVKLNVGARDKILRMPVQA